MQISNNPFSLALAEADQVVARLVPLLEPFAEASASLQEQLTAAWFKKIESLTGLRRYDDAVTACAALAKYIEPDEREPVPFELWPWLVRTWCEKITALARLEKFTEALSLAEKVQQRFIESDALAVREWVAFAGLEEIKLRVTLGGTFARVDMVRRSRQLGERFAQDDWPATQVLLARCRLWQGKLLDQLDYNDDALGIFTALHTDLGQAYDAELIEVAAEALHEKARLLRALRRKTETLETLQLLMSTYGGSAHTGTRQTLAIVQLNMISWWQNGDLPAVAGMDADAQALAGCDALIASHGGSADPVILGCVNRTLRTKAEILRERPDTASQALADEVTDAQWSRYADHPDANVVREVIQAVLNKLAGMENAPRLAGYEMLWARYGSVEDELLQYVLARLLQNKAFVHRKLGQSEEALVTLDLLELRYGREINPSIQVYAAGGRLERGYLFREAKRFDEAQAVLEKLRGITDADFYVRRVVARGMDLQADLWADQTPPKHEHQMGKDKDGKRIVVAMTPEESGYAKAVDDLVKRFSADKADELRTIAAKALYGLGVAQREHLHFEESIATYDRYLALFAGETTAAIEATTASAYLNKAYLLLKCVDRAAEALAVYDAVIARFTHATSADMRDSMAKAAASRLTCLNILQRQGVAVNYGSQYEDLPLEKRDAIQAKIESGRLLGVAGKYREAIAHYDEVLAQHVESLHPELRRQCLDALVRKGYCLGQLAQREAALEVNNEAIARYGNDLSTEMEKNVALAMGNKAVQLDKLGRHDEELKTYDEIIARWKASSVSDLRERVASAMFSNAVTLADRDLSAALALYREVMDRYLRAPEVKARRFAAKSAVNLGMRLRGLGQYPEAVSACETLLQTCGSEIDPEMQAQFVKARITLARTYDKVGQTQRQQETYRILLALPPEALTAEQRTNLQKEFDQLGASSKAGPSLIKTIGGWFGKRNKRPPGAA